MDLIIFNDNSYRNFFPIAVTRPVSDIRVGILKLRQRTAAFFEEENYKLVVPEYLKNLWKDRFKTKENFINPEVKNDILCINSRIKVTEESVKKIKEMPQNTFLTCGKEIAAVKTNKIESSELDFETIKNITDKLTGIEIKAKFWNYIWDFVNENAKMIEEDFKDFFYEGENFYETEQGVTVLNPYNVWIGEGTQILPGTVIDASEGPAVIDENVKIMPNSVITGPVYIGKNSIVKAASKIYEGTSVGPVCKVGGEIENTIFQAYSNKQHDGFLGHSFIGEWVNIGADTNNSDLKNNYKNVKVYSHAHKDKIDSGTKFLGCFIGDHAKIGINCSLNTGCVIDPGCNLYGKDLISDYVKSFSWGQFNNLERYKFDKFAETADAVKKRRNSSISDVEYDFYDKIFRNGSVI
ncbi:MAG: hypothetical protein CSB55_08000 [Candidatus Cloacimonadota bacterium]|nr:MAG: hypothetical protein CSB55_08000 [Candidatus Cloacimonadota bacterium]